MADAPPDAVERLYGLPLERFTAERDALAKELRGAGRRDEATAVKALRKPSQAAWVINQLARSERDAVCALLDAGAGLRAAQDAALAGGDGERLRTAAGEERAAVERLMAAVGSLAGAALSTTTLERVRATLHAAAGDHEVRAAIKDGRLVGEAEPGGGGWAWPAAVELPELDLERPAPRPPKRAKAERARAERAERTAQRAEAERAAQREQGERRKALEKELREARAGERRLRGAAETAQRAAERAADKLARALAAAQQARDEADAAQAAAADAGAEAERAAAEVARLEGELGD